MANGEWLTQLLSGLGGAFTGEVAARGRIAEEEEAKRKRDEAERMKEQERQLSELRKGLFKSFSPEAARAAVDAGLPLSDVSTIARLNEPTKTEPKITERRENGGIALYEGDNFKGWKIRPPSEREGPSPMQLQTEAKRDVRAAQSELRGAEGAFRSVLSGRPRQSQFKDPLTGLADTAAYGEALRAWRPESTYAAERRTGAQQDVAGAESALRRMMGQPEPTSQTGMAPNAAMQQQVAMEMQDAIRRIQNSALSPEEKRMRIEQVNQRATALLRAGGR
jgi:hypothetical protein